MTSEGMREFEGRCVLVTGAAGGVGRAVTAAFHAQGARVCVADLDCSGLSGDAALPGEYSAWAVVRRSEAAVGTESFGVPALGDLAPASADLRTLYCRPDL